MTLRLNETLPYVQSTYPHPGRLEWIGIRPGKRQEMIEVETARLITDHGIEGDHYCTREIRSDRQVTLIQAEHLLIIATLCKQEKILPSLLRRNLVISGINIADLKHKHFRLGNTELAGTGFCYPCFRMEENLGRGGYNTVRGHDGITARVIHGGWISTGDLLAVI